MIRYYISILFFLLFTPNIYSQPNKLVIHEWEIGVKYNKKTNKFPSNSILKSGDYNLKKNDTVFIIDARKTELNGYLPVTLDNSVDIELEFTFSYKININNAEQFIRVFFNSNYEREFLIPKVEELIYTNIKDFDEEEFKAIHEELISQKIVEKFNKNLELSKYFTLLEFSFM